MNSAEGHAGRPASHAIGMSNAAASGRIEEDYAGSQPYQHAIEIVRNGMQQHGTTDISIDIVSMPGTGALKRTFINNGPGLTEPELNTYMTTIGEGAGESWRLHNTLGQRHAGARTSILPFTDLMVLSWDAETIPGGLVMKLFKNPVTSEYEFVPASTPNPELLQILTGRHEVQRSGHGVAFIHTGREEHEDGPLCDPNPNKGETETGIADALRDRIYDPRGTEGQVIRITVNTPMPANQGKSFGGRKLIGVSRSIRLDGRTIQGHRPWTNRPAATGTVDVDDVLGVKVIWTLLPFTQKAEDRRLPYGGKGHIIARYKNESMVLAAPGGHYPDLSSKMRLFGVQLADVYNRLSLEIIGPTDPGDDVANPQLHIHQDPTRSKPVMSNGKELPLARWGERFVEQMPHAIVEANKAARERVSRGGKINLTTADRLRARLQSRIRAVIQSRRRKAGTGVLGHSGAPGIDYLDGMVNTSEALPIGSPSPTGEEGLTPGGTTKRRTKKRRKGAKHREPRIKPTGVSTAKRRTPGSEKATEVQPRPAPVPEPAPLKEADWIRQEFDPSDFASWDSANGVVYFNLGHSILCNQNAYFAGEWLEQNAYCRRRVRAEEVRDAVLQAYEEDTVGRIMHVVAERGLAKAREQLTDEVLTIGAHGFENVEAKIEEIIRKSAGRGVVDPKVA